MTKVQQDARDAWAKANEAWQAMQDSPEAQAEQDSGGIHPLDQAAYTAWQFFIDTFYDDARHRLSEQGRVGYGRQELRDVAESMCEDNM